MEHLIYIISKNNNYTIKSEDDTTKVTFNYRNKEFIIEHTNFDKTKIFWTGSWSENINLLQLIYHYQISANGIVKSIQDFKSTKVQFFPNSNENGIGSEDKIIFDKEIFYGGKNLIFYSSQK
jgi:hypothetical protein